MDLLNDHLAGKEMEIGRFYERSGKWLAANFRFRQVVDNYQTTSHAPEALERMVETYLALGIPQEAHKAAAVLGSNYPGSKWYKRAYNLMARHPAPQQIQAEVRAEPAAPPPALPPAQPIDQPPAETPQPATSPTETPQQPVSQPQG